MWDAILDALIDALKVLPILLVCYVLIELVELKTAKTLQNSKFLKGKYAPLFASAVGLIPQCGFSVIATDLYNKKSISLGTLFALYIATSDEAIPVLLSNPASAGKLWLILLIKFVLALIVGYSITLFTLINKNKKVDYVEKIGHLNNTANTKMEVGDTECEHDYLMADIHDDHHIGCCGHDIEENEQKITFWHFIKHPIMHSLKVFTFILAVNLVFGILIYFITEQSLNAFLSTTIWLQPLFAGLVGLIPNCASSVVVSKLFAMGGLTLGATITGLSANAGLGLMMLIKENKNKKQTLWIIVGLYLVSVVAGYIITLF